VIETGIITGFGLTPANGSEREALWDLVPSIQGLFVGDKGYLSAPLKAELQHHGIPLETPYRANMQERHSPHYRALLQRTRRLIETVIGQLSERFSIEKVWARDLWHLVSRLNHKLLAHTVGYWLHRHSPDPLWFEFLVSPSLHTAQKLSKSTGLSPESSCRFVNPLLSVLGHFGTLFLLFR
jgi:hypothetical protein